MTYSLKIVAEAKEMATKYNLLKTKQKAPLMVPIDLAIHIVTVVADKMILRQMKKEGATSCGVYWTGKVCHYTTPKNKAYAEFCEKKNAKWWADYRAGVIENNEKQAMWLAQSEQAV